MSEHTKKVLIESIGMITTAFGLVAALAWNEAIKNLISEILPRGQGVLSLFIYAILVTVLAVFISARLLKIKERFEEERKQ